MFTCYEKGVEKISETEEFAYLGQREGVFQRFQETPCIKFGLLSLQQEPNTLFSLAAMSS